MGSIEGARGDTNQDVIQQGAMSSGAHLVKIVIPSVFPEKLTLNVWLAKQVTSNASSIAMLNLLYQDQNFHWKHLL